MENKRTPVRVRVRRIEAGAKTPNKRTREVKRLRKSNTDLSPGQKKIEAFFKRKTLVGRPGLSREADNTNKDLQGAGNSPLEGVLNSGASTPTSRGSRSLPVERGGGEV